MDGPGRVFHRVGDRIAARSPEELIGQEPNARVGSRRTAQSRRSSKAAAPNIKNIIGAGKKGAESIRGMQREVTLMEKDLARIQRTMSKGGSQNGGLIMAERELKAAIEETNRSIERQQVRLARIENVKAKATSLADGLGKAGAFASASITAPLGLVAASMDNLAERARGMQNAANVAGMGFEAFQRGAYAAQSVGIEYDKFGDILKDTQDKIGDFVANKGGEMADFFKNVAPKVHVTAKSFKDLSGADAVKWLIASADHEMSGHGLSTRLTLEVSA
ncbi:hypothetical protein [uncultured Novosphingobium sp.]|uniref:hypothetical protein n=1 Tax=uncultured Novosphingobium sp. TaxID=292277 RepID=UPI0025955E19|nr:hypothetical protein [uncultured Novosphingobium sp.]